MAKRFIYSPIYVFLVGLLSSVFINFVGELTIGLLLVAAALPFFNRFTIRISYAAFLKYLVPIFILQLFWLVLSNDNIKSVKGIAVVISGVVYFIYFYSLVEYRFSNLMYYYLGVVCSYFVWGSRLADIEGTEFGEWKFTLYPLLRDLLIVIYLFFVTHSRRDYSSLFAVVMMLFGLVGVISGVRSVGLVVFLSGFVYLAYILLANVSKRLKIVCALLCFALLYGGYVIYYVPKVLNGEISAGNSQQIDGLSNPYNPLNLLFMGRTDSFVPFLAWSEKPFLGWGYNSEDPNGRFSKAIASIRDEVGNQSHKIRSLKRTIPSHSVLGGFACAYGIVAFICLVLLMYSIARKVLVIMGLKSGMLLLCIYLFFSLAWNLLFSPIAHFKTMTSQIAIIMFLYDSELQYARVPSRFV